MIGPAAARLTWEERLYDTRHRWHLMANDLETPFFLEIAAALDRRLGHKRISLCGMGLCSAIGCAATLEGFCRIDAAKARAELLWRQWTVSGELERRIEAGERARRAFYSRHGRQENGEPLQEVA